MKNGKQWPPKGCIAFCVNCRWWKKIPQDKCHIVDAHGECYRFPPILNASQVAFETTADNHEGMATWETPHQYARDIFSWVFPITQSIHCCGEWQHGEGREKDADTAAVLKELDSWAAKKQWGCKAWP